MSATMLMIGTKKGLWLARSDDRESWSVDGPHFLMNEVVSVALDNRRGSTAAVDAAMIEQVRIVGAILDDVLKRE